MLFLTLIPYLDHIIQVLHSIWKSLSAYSVLGMILRAEIKTVTETDRVSLMEWGMRHGRGDEHQ